MVTFIKNEALRKTIEDSIEYTGIIFENARKSSNNTYKEETYRVIILYVIAVIEAILLYVLNERGDKITTLSYKSPNEISEKIKHLDFPDEKLVTAIQTIKVKKDNEIGMKDLVDFMKKNKLMKAETAENILEINNIRNTFHLTKSRVDVNVEIEKVEKAFSLLYKIIEGAPKAIKKPKQETK